MENKNLNENIVRVLDKNFPKGDSARGRALLLVAMAHVELEKQKNDILELIKKKRQWYEKELKNGNVGWSQETFDYEFPAIVDILKEVEKDIKEMEVKNE